MNPIALVIIILALGCGGYAAVKADARFAGGGVVLLALLELLAVAS